MGRSFFIIGTVIGSVMLFLFLPITFETDIHYDLNRKKLAFSVFIYKFFKVIGGYCTVYSGGIAIHRSSQKVILKPYAQLDNDRKRFSFMRSFRLSSFVLTTETGAEYLLEIALIQILLRVIFVIKGGTKEDVENNLWLTDGDVLRISLNFIAYFNLFILLREFVKFLKEKMSLLWQKKMKKSIV